MHDIKFKIAAKTDAGIVRANNEDNFQAASDLSTQPMKWVNNAECDLGDKGALLVVADGMGGMNAGEIASEIAVETIKEHFAPENITEQTLNSQASINFFLKKAIIDADKRIKEEAKNNDGHKGMGTTIVVAWLISDQLYVAWCGDSRAYIYNRLNGLKQITKDHSYVQTLVDKGKIKPDEAFDFPDSNIITRSLSDTGQKARPDILPKPIKVCNGDIILLCTDGLSGMIRDHEIEQVLMENDDNMSDCADNLIKAACEAAGEDNVTVALCKIISGCSDPSTTRVDILDSQAPSPNSSRIHFGYIMFFIVGLLIAFGAGYKCGSRTTTNPIDTVMADSVVSDSVTTPNDTIADEIPVKAEEVEVKGKNESQKIDEAPKDLVVKVPKQEKSDTTYIVKKNETLSSIVDKIGRPNKTFDILLKDSFLVRDGVIVSAQIKENDTLKFKNRGDIRK